MILSIDDTLDYTHFCPKPSCKELSMSKSVTYCRTHFNEYMRQYKKTVRKLKAAKKIDWGNLNDNKL